MQPGTHKLCMLKERVRPSNVTDSCTHKPMFNQFPPAVKECGEQRDQDKCMGTDQSKDSDLYKTFCEWIKSEEPSTAWKTCTHLFMFNTNSTVRDTCAAAGNDRDSCNFDDGCIWNECDTDFGTSINARANTDEHICPSERNPYCVQANGFENPGQCYKEEIKTIKCLPA